MANKIKLTFLGTASQMPSARRNHTAILLNYKDENLLVDCGEGTQRQFRKARLNPCKITRLLITHWHGDHVFGIPGILSTLALSGYNKTLYVYGPRGIKDSMKNLLQVFKFEYNYEIKVEEVIGDFFENSDFILSAEKMDHGIPINAYCFSEKNKFRIDKKKLEKMKLPAGPHLQKLKEGKDISYDGKKYLARDLLFEEKGKKVCFILDTKMNERIINFARDSNFFVCEASFSDDLAVKANDYSHLTATGAANIAKKAEVEKLILTHIGGRYEKNPLELEKEAKKIFKKTVVAKDLDSFEIE